MELQDAQAQVAAARTTNRREKTRITILLGVVAGCMGGTFYMASSMPSAGNESDLALIAVTSVTIAGAVTALIAGGYRKEGRIARREAEAAIEAGELRKAADVMLGTPRPGIDVDNRGIRHARHWDSKLWAEGVEFVFAHGEFWIAPEASGLNFGVELTAKIVKSLGRIPRGATQLFGRTLDVSHAPEAVAEIAEAAAVGSSLDPKTAVGAIEFARRHGVCLRANDGQCAVRVENAVGIAVQISAPQEPVAPSAWR